MFDLDWDNVEKAEVVEHEPASTERSAARRAALQVLYEVDCAGHTPDEVIAARLQEEPLPRKAGRYLRALVYGVIQDRDKLDQVIQQYAPEWPIDQVAIIDRNILRMALLEMVSQMTPINVAISEAIDLALLFGADGTSRFVNGVLGLSLIHISGAHET
jgi:N utilization substance protein B